MKSLLIFAIAIAVMIAGKARIEDSAEQGFGLIGLGLALFLVGAVVNHGEHTNRRK